MKTYLISSNGAIEETDDSAFEVLYNSDGYSYRLTTDVRSIDTQHIYHLYRQQRDTCDLMFVNAPTNKMYTEAVPMTLTDVKAVALMLQQVYDVINNPATPRAVRSADGTGSHIECSADIVFPLTHCSDDTDFSLYVVRKFKSDKEYSIQLRCHVAGHTVICALFGDDHLSNMIKFFSRTADQLQRA